MQLNVDNLCNAHVSLSHIVSLGFLPQGHKNTLLPVKSMECLLQENKTTVIKMNAALYREG